MKCPKCGSEHYCGNEVSVIYDGVLFWSCLDCRHAWARDWTGFGRRQQAADQYVFEWNAARAGEAATQGGPTKRGGDK